MPKAHWKKRRHDEMTSTVRLQQQQPASHYDATNLQMESGDDSIDNILAEMAEQQGVRLSSSSMDNHLTAATSTTTLPTTLASTSIPTDQEEEDSRDAINLFNPTIPTPPLTKQQRDRIRLWNHAMYSWQKSGVYSNVTQTTVMSPQEFVPSFDVEMTRHFKIQAISSFLLDTCKGLKMPAFERWLIDSKVEESTYNYGSSSRTDPILNPNVTTQYTSSQRLMDEICEISNKKIQSTTTTSSSSSIIIKRNDAKKIVQDLCRRTNIAVQEIYQQQLLLLNQTSSPPIKKGDRIELEGHPPVYTLVYHRHKKWKKPYCIKINATHYNKLYNMFVRVHGNDLQFKENGNNKLTMSTHIFHYIVMVLLLRYSSLSGGQLIFDLRGGGMQGAVHDSVFDTLHHDLYPNDTMIEGFGSPLNAYLSGFYSAFAYDIDWHFGSRGNFLHEPIYEGCCEVNPPFAPGIMNAMADRIDCNISIANERNSTVTFIVIVPNGGNENDVNRAAAKRYGSQSLQQMIESEHCTYHFILKAKEHGYIEGAQHLRPTRYKESLYDTSIIVLQSKTARETRTIDKDMLEDKIRIAFASRHRHEVESRKEMKPSFT